MFTIYELTIIRTELKERIAEDISYANFYKFKDTEQYQFFMNDKKRIKQLLEKVDSEIKKQL